MSKPMVVLARVGNSREYLPLFDDDEQPARSVKVQIDGLEVTILHRPTKDEQRGIVDVRIDPINGEAVGIDHWETAISRTQVSVRVSGDETGRGLLP